MIFVISTNYKNAKAVFREKIALTPQTKCVETIVIFFVAAFIILTNKEMFFEREHIGYLLSYHEEREVDD